MPRTPSWRVRPLRCAPYFVGGTVMGGGGVVFAEEEGKGPRNGHEGSKGSNGILPSYWASNRGSKKLYSRL